jgi:hypothetical protein
MFTFCCGIPKKRYHLEGVGVGEMTLDVVCVCVCVRVRGGINYINWLELVNSLVILGVAWKARNFLTSWVTVRFWRSKLFHEVKDRRLISTSMSFPKRTRLSSPNHYMSQCDRNKNDYFTVSNCFAHLPSLLHLCFLSIFVHVQNITKHYTNYTWPYHELTSEAPF